MATEKCQNRREQQNLSPALITAGGEERRTWLNTTISSPGALSPGLFSSSISVCCEMLQSETSSCACRFMLAQTPLRARMRFMQIFIFRRLMRRSPVSSVRQTETQQRAKNTVMYTEQLKPEQVMHHHPWALLRIKVHVNLISDSQFKLVSRLHHRNLWLIHNRSIQWSVDLQHTHTLTHTSTHRTLD